jgi:hypothetical protein
MHAAPGRSRRRTDEEARHGCRVRHPPGHGAGPKLAQVLDPSDDVAADVVRVAPLHLGAVHRRARDDQVAEARGEALDLGLDRIRHVARRPARHVAVGPSGVLALGGAGRVEQARLHEQHEGALVVAPAHGGVLRRGDLAERAAQVDRPGARRLGRAPRDRPVERPVELEDARAVAVPLEAPAIAVRQPVARNAQQLARRDVDQHRRGVAQLVERLDAAPGLHRPAGAAQLGGEGLGQALRSATGDRPADRMGTHAEDEPEGGGRGRAERQEGVRAAAGEQGTRPLALEARAGKRPRRADPAEAEAGHGERVAGRAERAEELAEEGVGVANERGEEAAVGGLVVAQLARRPIDLPMEDYSRPVVEGVGEWDVGVNEIERKLAQEGRGERQRVDGRAGVVHVARERQLGGAAPAPHRVLALEHGDAATRAGERDGGRQPVWARADHEGVRQSRRA